MWNESGFTVTETGTSTDMGTFPGDPGRYLNTLVEVGAQLESSSEPTALLPSPEAT